MLFVVYGNKEYENTPLALFWGEGGDGEVPEVYYVLIFSNDFY